MTLQPTDKRSSPPQRRVLLASHHASRRGSAISLVELGTRIAEYGYEPVFVFSKAGDLADDLRQRGFHVVEIRRAGMLRLATIRTAYSLIRKLGISLVHVNSAVAFSKYIAMAGRLAGVPVLWHIREPVEDKRMARQRKWIRWLADRIVVLTRQQAAFFNAPEKTARVFNGVDVERFRRRIDKTEAKRALGYSSGDFVFVQIGSIEHNKGQSRSAEALVRLLPDFPAARLLIVGSTVEASELENLHSLGMRNPTLGPALRLHGESTDVSTLLWAADCLLLPSLRESFPRTVMEAMATGVPVIATAVGAVEDMVEEGNTGFLVTPGSVDALSAAMRRMLDMEPLAAQGMSSRCEHAARKTFAMAAHVSAITTIYDQLLLAAS